MTITRATTSLAETVALGRSIGAALPRRAIVTLSGPLGGGKTALVSGIVNYRTNEPISSPTFVYHQRYSSAEAPIDHVDLYRLRDNPSILAPSGILDLVETVPGWLLIEWPLTKLPFPSNVPLLAIAASGAPLFQFTLTTTDPEITAALESQL